MQSLLMYIPCKGEISKWHQVQYISETKYIINEALSILESKKTCYKLLGKALILLLNLEKDGFKPGVETLAVLIDWLGKLGLVEEAE
jgi:hypothetical protein